MRGIARSGRLQRRKCVLSLVRRYSSPTTRPRMAQGGAKDEATRLRSCHSSSSPYVRNVWPVPVICHPHSCARHRYLLTYDPLAFHAYLETIIASNSASASGGTRQHQSPWLLTDAANIIFKVAKRRCYTLSSTSKSKVQTPLVIDLVDDDDVWDVLDEIEGHIGTKDDMPKEKGEKKKPWVPDDMDPVLEELPKWSLLADVLKEIEEEMMRQESLGTARSICGSLLSNMFMIRR